MKGLLTKDFLLLKKHGVLNVIIAFAFFIMSMISNEASYAVYYSIIIFSILFFQHWLGMRNISEIDLRLLHL